MNNATQRAIELFNYRQEAVGRCLPCDPDWERVMREALGPAKAGERGVTDQEQCAYQGTRLFLFESGQVLAPWTKAFLPKPVAAVIALSWYLRWWTSLKTFLKRLRDFL